MLDVDVAGHGGVEPAARPALEPDNHRDAPVAALDVHDRAIDVVGAHGAQVGDAVAHLVADPDVVPGSLHLEHDSTLRSVRQTFRNAMRNASEEARAIPCPRLMDSVSKSEALPEAVERLPDLGLVGDRLDHELAALLVADEGVGLRLAGEGVDEHVFHLAAPVALAIAVVDLLGADDAEQDGEGHGCILSG